MGNSEVGHLNMGAGRVVDQDIVRISKRSRIGELLRNPAFVDAVKNARGVHLPGCSPTAACTRCRSICTG